VRETIPRALDGERLDRVVALLTGLPRSRVAELVEAGDVRVGGTAAASRSRRVAEGEVVDVDLPANDVEVLRPAPDSGVVFEVVHADEHVIVVDKPAGLVVHPGAGNVAGTLVNGLLARFPDLAGVGDPGRPGVVHRLDRGTSGLLVVARTHAAHASLVAQLRARAVERAYVALAWGSFEAPAGLIDAPVGRAEVDRTRMAISARGREARTRYRVRRSFTHPTELSLVECRLETGRTHQIRVHLAAIGHPLVGDSRYRGARPSVPLGRPFLHAYRLAFDHPATGRRVEHEVALPDDLAEVVAALR
jgi:23S rRNA pseudouridine1911/1915/1917 synthase